MARIGGLGASSQGKSSSSGGNPVLATIEYAPTSIDSWAIPPSTLAVNAFTAGGNVGTIAFTVPANGIVDVTVQGVVLVSAVGVTNGIVVGLFEHGTTTVVGNTQSLAAIINLSEIIFLMASVKFHLTGLTPGPFQVDLAAGIIGPSGALATWYAMGSNSSSVAAQEAGTLLMQATASA